MFCEPEKIKNSDGLGVYFNSFIKKNKRIVKLGIFLFPFILVIMMTMLKWKFPFWYRKLVWKEDSIVEYLTAIFYFFSCLISYSISVYFYKNKFKLYSLPYFILTVCFFFIAMEEISWGQRLLGIGTPEEFYKYTDFQKEINFHNLKIFPIHTLPIVVSLYGGLARFLIPKSVIRNYRPIVNYFTPDYYLVFYFLIVGILYLYIYPLGSLIVSLLGGHSEVEYRIFGLGKEHFIRTHDQEPAEFLLSVGFLLFVLINKYRQLWDKDNIFWNIRYSAPRLS